MFKSIKIIFFLIVGIVYGQGEITGKIIDSDTGMAIPYVNIGIKDKAVGTVTNKNGSFNLSLNSNTLKDDNVIFSHLGYETKEYLVSSLLNNNNTIELDPNATELEEVVVQFKAPKTKKIGRKSVGLGLMHINFYTVNDKKIDDKLSRERGMIFNLKRNCKIEELLFHIKSNEFKYLKFRVNFYRIENKVPSELLNTQDIFFEVKDGYLGWYEANFKDADVYLDNDLEKVGVTIQWVESVKEKPDSDMFAISAAMAPKKT